ncbi:hypothetical protein BJV74DRAFT_806649 [Russula compacta]|nr:hypothetical protein BJV74DRAFT_806649 [Russula compacta]
MASDFDFESSDILGGSLPVGRGRVAQNSGFSSFFKICALGASTLLLLLAFRHGRAFFLRWKERHYKLSMRRRYGIPDHDLRPFNVAYAAARLAQEDKKKIQDRMRNVLASSQSNPHEPTGPGMVTHIRLMSAAVTGSIGEGYGLATQQILTPATLQVSGYDKNAKSIAKRSPFPASTATEPLRIPLPSSHADVSGYPGHTGARDESEDQHETKPEGGHVVHDSGIAVDSASAPRRSKRMADSSDDSDLRYSQENRHDKRRRKVSARHIKKRMQRGVDVEMNGVSEVELSRGGKKRDRTETDSSFGADDMPYNDQDTDSALHHHRKRRQRKSTNASRGQKRGRDVDSLGVDIDQGDLRGRRKAFRHRPDTSDTDPSVEDGQISRDPLCRGRCIGEEWEAHGVQFRVGPDGRRLRRVLVKEDRPKFSMPVDSEHPDRSASVTAIIERWYTEEQYLAAREAHELAWQDSDKSFVEPDTPGDRTGNPSNAGKQLLWASTSNPGSPVRKIRISGHSSIASPRVVLFPVPPPPQYTRRVLSLYSSSAAKLMEMSPKLRPSKSYSKWEKQEIEAEAITRLRRKAEEKEKATAEAEAKKIANAPTPTVSLTKSDEKPSVAPSTGASPFSLPPLPKSDSRVPEPSNPPVLFKIPTPSSNTQLSEVKDKPEAKTAWRASAPAPATSGPVSSNSTIPDFFTQNAKVPSNYPISNPLSAPQGNGSKPTQGFFSFSQPSNPTISTNNNSNPSSSGLSVGGTDALKPKFNFGMTSKPTSSTPHPPPVATASDPSSKPMFSFGIPKSSSAQTAQPVTNPFSNAPASSATATQTNQPSMFGTSEGKPTGAPQSGIVSVSSGIKAGEGANLSSQGQSAEVANGSSTMLFGVPSGGTQATAKPPLFASANMPTTNSFFSFGAGSDTSSEKKPEPGKGASMFAFNASSTSSTPAAVPPTPGSVFSDTAAKSSQNVGPIPQPSFGAPKNGTGSGTTSGFSFGQSSAPFSFGSFGAQKS